MSRRTIVDCDVCGKSVDVKQEPNGDMRDPSIEISIRVGVRPTAVGHACSDECATLAYSRLATVLRPETFT